VFFLDGSRRRVPVKGSRGLRQPNGQHQLPRVIGDGQAVVVDVPTKALEGAQREGGNAIKVVEVEASGKRYHAASPSY
jgi:hypothetical protein